MSTPPRPPLRERLERLTLPRWWKPERPEHRGNPLLQQCAQAGMTAEQALDELAGAYANLEVTACRLAERQAPRFVIPADGPKEKP